MPSLFFETVNGRDVRMIEPGEHSASRWNRANRSPSVATASGSTLMATCA